MMAKRKMSLNELSRKVNIPPGNLNILITGNAKEIQFSTLDILCTVLQCQPADLLEWLDETSYNRLFRR